MFRQGVLPPPCLFTGCLAGMRTKESPMLSSTGEHVMVTPSVLYTTECAIAGIDAGEQGHILVNFDGWTTEDGENRKVVRYFIYGTDGDLIGSGDEIRGGVDNDIDALDALATVLSFLLACAESRSESSENYNLFPTPVREWAEMVSDELSSIGFEVEQERA